MSDVDSQINKIFRVANSGAHALPVQARWKRICQPVAHWSQQAGTCDRWPSERRIVPKCIFSSSSHTGPAADCHCKIEFFCGG
jgi:hypothetical protein